MLKIDFNQSEIQFIENKNIYINTYRTVNKEDKQQLQSRRGVLLKYKTIGKTIITTK